MPSSDYLVQLIGIAAIAAIALICRWVFSTGSRRALPVAPSGEEDLGLLVPLAQVRTRDEAELMRGLLTKAGVRSGVSEAPDGIRLLVFDKDLELARQLVSP